MLTSLESDGWLVVKQPTRPGKRGPSWRYSNAGGASAALAQRQGANRGLQEVAVCGAEAKGCEFNSLPSLAVQQIGLRGSAPAV